MPDAASTPPPMDSYRIPSIPRLTALSNGRPSIGSSLSLGPKPLVSSYIGDTSSHNIGQNRHSLGLDPNQSILPASPRLNRHRHFHKQHRRDGGGSPHPLANDTTDVFQDSYLGEETSHVSTEREWGMTDRMRLWRHDALMQHLYDTAAFWGDKVLSWTHDPNDAFWLAQTYFMMHQYSRAEKLLTRPFYLNPPKEEKRTSMEDGMAAPMPMPPRLPSALIEIPEEMKESVSRLVDMSVACRCLAAQCQVRQGHWEDAMETLGEANPFRGSERSGATVPNLDGGIKIEASMCHLRGVLMLKVNRGDQAKQCFMEALALDIKCYEAFDQLVSGEMMTPDEEWEFVQGLAYKTQAPEDADFIQLIYTSRLRKYKHGQEHALTRQRLVNDYGLSDNPDVLFSFAEAIYTQYRWADCFAITSRILDIVSAHGPTLPLHIACMFHINKLHSKLFIMAHELVEKEPSNPVSWYAVGVYYLATQKFSQSRQFFSKTSLMDPRFGPAWISFAHTFSMEGEHDHAVTAYSTCARLFTGSHLPLMFIGMEHLMLSNDTLASEALEAALRICDGDPLLMNECGVLAYTRGDYKAAADWFTRSLSAAQVSQGSQKSWVPTYLNLGSCLRKLKRFEEARGYYQKVLDIDPKHAQALGFIGLTYHLLGKYETAVLKYHEALSVDPINTYLVELMNMALDATSFSEGPKSMLTRASGWDKTLASMRTTWREVEARFATEYGLTETDTDMNVG